MTDPALTIAWDQQGLWSATANELKRQIIRSRSLILTLVALGALVEIGAAALASEEGQWGVASGILGGLGAGMLAVAAVIRSRRLGHERVRDWIRARSASEALKATVYLYLTRSGEYAGTAAARTLSATVNRITSQVEDLARHAARLPAPHREAPRPLDLAGYVKERVETQIVGYYHPQSANLARQLGILRRLELALLLLASALGAAATMLESAALAGWVAAVTTLTAAVAAHIEGSRYEHLIVTYRGTALRLEALGDRWRDELLGRPVTPAEASSFVRSCEDAISVETEGWMAEVDEGRLAH